MSEQHEALTSPEQFNPELRGNLAAAESHTQAVKYDPFADDGPDTAAATGPQTAPGTAPTMFDPFADDSTASELALPEDVAGIKNLLDNLGGVTGRAHQAAIDTFRERRRAQRSARPVADGMVNLPFVEPGDPEAAVLTPAQIAAQKVAPPVLQPGDVVAGQYRIAGPLAHGGMGWIYLAQDENVSGRWVVLKGLLGDTNAVPEAEREFLADITHPGIVKIYNFFDDPRVKGGLIVTEYISGPTLKDRRKEQPAGVFPLDIAIAYMLEVLPALDYLHARGVVYNDLKPDNIIVTEDQVKLIDLGAVSGIGAYGYIFGTKGFQAPEVATKGPSVASDIYTVGRTLAALVCHLPVENGAYRQELPTPAEEPIFRKSLSFYRLLQRCCDPDPAKRFRDISELTTQLYGVLREVLAVRDGKQYPAQHSLFSPQRRTFGTKHLVFRTDRLLDGIERSVQITPPEVIAALPVPLIDRSDPGAALLSGSSYTEPQEVLENLRAAMERADYLGSTEVPLGIVRSLLDLGYTAQASAWLKSLEPTLGSDWRYQWYSGITCLLADDFRAAQKHFSEVLRILPGESAPKLALAATGEMLLQQQGLNHTKLLDADLVLATYQLATNAVMLAGTAPGDAANNSTSADDELSGELAQLRRAQYDAPSLLPSASEYWDYVTDDPHALRICVLRLYGLVWTCNPTTVSSGFGLARTLMTEGQTELAVLTLDAVPQPSRHHRMARLTTILLLIGGDPEFLSERRLRRAARRLEKVPNNEPRLGQIKVAIMTAALRWLRATGRTAASEPAGLLEFPFTQRGLRNGIADTLRQLARSTSNRGHRYALVDMANKVRPTTWF